jgi:probable F420-dependent oxidoreductase
VKLGITLPNMGAHASPAAITRAAREAESLGLDMLWACDRLLFPLHPRTPYPASADGKLPESAKRAMDPVEALTFAAAHTSRIGLGTAVLNIPFYNPVVLARRLATLDVLSGGRLRVGLGLGWSADELEAAGAAPERGARADEFVQVLRAAWGPDPVAFDGRHFRIAPSVIGLKPAQVGGPPIYMAAYTPAALARTARLADGWLPSMLPLPMVAERIPELRRLAAEAGRDPATLALIYMTSVKLTPAPLGAGRWAFTGSAEEIGQDVAELRRLGIGEMLVLDFDQPRLEDYLALMARMRRITAA